MDIKIKKYISILVFVFIIFLIPNICNAETTREQIIQELTGIGYKESVDKDDYEMNKLISEYQELYNAWDTIRKNTSDKTMLLDAGIFVEHQNYFCIKAHRGVGITEYQSFNELNQKYNEAVQSYTQSLINGEPSIAQEGKRKVKVKAYLKMKIANLKAKIVYQLKECDVDTKQNVTGNSTLSSEQIIAMAYFIAMGGNPQKPAYGSVEDYISDNYGFNDENSKTMWAISGNAGFSTEDSKKALQYAKDLTDYKKTQESSGSGKEKDGYIVAKITVPINLKTEDDVVSNANNSGNFKFYTDENCNNEIAIKDLKKGDVYVKVKKEEGKTEYTDTVKFDYKTFKGKFNIWFDGAYVNSSTCETQNFLEVKTNFETETSKGTWKITITTEDTPTTEIKVTKRWDTPAGFDGDIPTVTIKLLKLLKDGSYEEIASLDLTNGETKAFENLESGYEYAVQEEDGKTPSYTKGKTTYTYTYDTGIQTVQTGQNIEIVNKITGEDEPDPNPEPEPGDGEPNLEVKKEVVYVFSDYEGNTSSEDVVSNKEANVQRWDEVVFKITVTNTSKDGEEYEDDTYFDSTDPNEKVDKKDPEKKTRRM